MPEQPSTTPLPVHWQSCAFCGAAIWADGDRCVSCGKSLADQPTATAPITIDAPHPKQASRFGNYAVRGAILLFVLLPLHLAVGLVGLVVYADQTGWDYSQKADPHPLNRWFGPAFALWVVAALAIMLLTKWMRNKRLMLTQFLLPIVWLGSWLPIAFLVGPYPATLDVEVRHGVVYLSTITLAPGELGLGVANSSDIPLAVAIIRSNTPMRHQRVTDGIYPSEGNGMAWVPIGDGYEGGLGSARRIDLLIEPGERGRLVIETETGYYAVVCTKPTGEGYPRVVIDGSCRPAFFTVGMR